MGHFGFSYVGLIYLLMLFIPNIMWAKKQPEGYNPSGENKILLVMERIGQALVTCCALMFSDSNIRAFTMWSLWLVASFILMLIYELYWVRYFNTPTLDNFYRPFCGIPAPGATLPVLAFLLLGVYGKVIWMIVAVVLLGVGHIGIHLQHIQKMKRENM